MAINRVLYATQTVRLNTGSNWYSLPAQTASADETIPQDDVLVMGKLGGVARLQKDVATCKASIKAYIVRSITGSAVTGHGLGGTVMDVGALDIMLDRLTADAAAGLPGTILVDSAGSGNSADGFKFVGTLSSIGVDAS